MAQEPLPAEPAQFLTAPMPIQAQALRVGIEAVLGRLETGEVGEAYQYLRALLALAQSVEKGIRR